ncbi:MAG TPA: glycosyltransferase family 4 protein, partial [Verrucomicrobiae bacterium]
MKIVLLTTDNRDHDHDFGAAAPRFGTAPEALLQGLAQIPELEVHVVSCVHQPVAAPQKLAANIFYHAVVVPRWGWMRTGYLGCIRAVRRKLRQLNPDLVHGQGTERDCAISAVSSGYPNVLTIHGNMRMVAAVYGARPFSFFWLAARLERFTLPRTHGVVCITHYTQQAVQSLAPRTWVLPNAVDVAFFDLTPRPDPAAPPMILCVGLITARKNQNDFIRALDSLVRERPLRVVFLGKIDDGEYGREFQQLLRERSWCEHVPFSNRPKVREYFQAATVVALPTREDNCPMVVLEAMAAGVPVIASRVGGVPD